MRAVRLTAVTAVLLCLCGVLLFQPHQVYAAGTVRVAQQYGLWCAINTVVVEKKLIEKYAPGTTVTETRFASGADIRSALRTQSTGHITSSKGVSPNANEIRNRRRTLR